MMNPLFLALALIMLALGICGCSVGQTCDQVPSEPEQTQSVNQTMATDPTEIPVESSASATVETIISTEPESNDVFVRVVDYIPDLIVDLKYATTDNFTGQIIYMSDDAYLRYGTVKKLVSVQAKLKQTGRSLKLWDGFRPPSAQFKLWEICPDPTYVSDPNNGFSSHSRGNTVDITVVDQNGVELKMPTKFDDFSTKANRDYSDCTQEEAENAAMLEVVMTENGFKGYYGEWWHFTDTDTYEVEMVFVP